MSWVLVTPRMITRFFLQICECSVAVRNALTSIKERVDLVMNMDRGEGVAELADRLKADDLASILPQLLRHNLHLGTDNDDHLVGVPPFGSNIMIAGSSGSGKTTRQQGSSSSWSEAAISSVCSIRKVITKVSKDRLKWAVWAEPLVLTKSSRHFSNQIGAFR